MAEGDTTLSVTTQFKMAGNAAADLEAYRAQVKSELAKMSTESGMELVIPVRADLSGFDKQIAAIIANYSATPINIPVNLVPTGTNGTVGSSGFTASGISPPGTQFGPDTYTDTAQKVAMASVLKDQFSTVASSSGAYPLALRPDTGIEQFTQGVMLQQEWMASNIQRFGGTGLVRGSASRVFGEEVGGGNGGQDFIDAEFTERNIVPLSTSGRFTMRPGDEEDIGRGIRDEMGVSTYLSSYGRGDQVPPDEGTKGKSSNLSMRKLFLWAAAARGAYADAEAMGDAGKAIYQGFSNPYELSDKGKADSYSESVGAAGQVIRKQNIVAQEETFLNLDVQGGQNAIKAIPLLGNLIQGVGDTIYRSISASKNFAEGKGFESDEGYAENMDEQIKEQEKHTAIIEKQAELRKKINDELDKTTQKLNDQATIEREGNYVGSKSILAHEQASMEKDFAENPIYHLGGNTDQPLTDSAKAYMAAQRLNLADMQDKNESEKNNSDEQKREKDAEDHNQTLALQNRLDVAVFESTGDERDAKQYQFRQRQQDEWNNAHAPGKMSDSDLAVFDATQKQEQNTFDFKNNWSARFTTSEAQRKIGDIQAQSQETSMRSSGDSYGASVMEGKQTQKDLTGQIADLEKYTSVMKDDTDAVNKLNEARAKLAATTSELNQMEQEHEHSLDVQHDAIQSQTDVLNLRASGQGGAASDKEFAGRQKAEVDALQHKIQSEVAAGDIEGAANDMTALADLNKRQDAEKAFRDMNVGKQGEAIRLETLRATAEASGDYGLKEEASYEALRERIVGEEENVNPANQGLLQKQSQAEILAFQKQQLAGGWHGLQTFNGADSLTKIFEASQQISGASGLQLNKQMAQDLKDLSSGKDIASDLTGTNAANTTGALIDKAVTDLVAKLSAAAVKIAILK